MNSEERESVKGPAPGPVEANPRMDNGPIPGWLIAVIGFGIFWAGAYLFSYSGGFAADVFDYQPKYGVQAAAAAGPPDPKVLGKKLFSANCVTCHQSSGAPQGLVLEDGKSWRSLLQGRSAESKLALVTPSKPDESYLFHKLAGTQSRTGGGAQMPPGDPLAPDKVAIVQRWIAAGAPNN